MVKLPVVKSKKSSSSRSRIETDDGEKISHHGKNNNNNNNMTMTITRKQNSSSLPEMNRQKSKLLLTRSSPSLKVLEKKKKKKKAKAKKSPRRGLPMMLDEASIRLFQEQTMFSAGYIQPVRVGEKLIMVKEELPNSTLRQREEQLLGELLQDRRPSTAVSQRLDRNLLGEEDFAAILIQCFWRFHISKVRLNQKRAALRQKLYDAATTIQSAARRKLAQGIVRKARRRRLEMTSSTKITKVWRGKQGREKARKRKAYLERLELERASATIIQATGRKFLVRSRLQFRHGKAATIQNNYRASVAKRRAKFRKHAAQKLGHFGRFHATRLRYGRMKRGALTLQCFWRQALAVVVVEEKRFEREQKLESFRRDQAAKTIQALIRGVQGRRKATEKRHKARAFQTSLQERSDLELIIDHLVKHAHVNNPQYLKDRYHDGMVQYADSAALLYGRAILSAVGEKDEKSALEIYVADATRIDTNGEEKQIVQYILEKGIQKSDTDQIKAQSFINQAMFWVLTELHKEEQAVELLSKAIVLLEEVLKEDLIESTKARLENLKRYAEKYIAKYNREISTGVFQHICMQDEEMKISDLDGRLTIWQRGINFRFQFTHKKDEPIINGEKKTTNSKRRSSMRSRTSTISGGGPKFVKKELIVPARRVREVMRQLDRNDLSRGEEKHAELIRLLVGMLNISQGKLLLSFRQEPFPRMTHFAPSTRSFLTVVPSPADPTAIYMSDMVFYATDNSIGEEYSVKIKNEEIETWFADMPRLLSARTKPGWRRNCRALVAKLVGLIDLEDVEVPDVGDFVVSLDPIWKTRKEEALRRGFEVVEQERKGKGGVGSRWYRVGRVKERSGINFKVEPFVEVSPKGSLCFRPDPEAYNKEGILLRAYTVDLQQVRLAKMEQQAGNDWKLIQPRIRIGEPPQVNQHFRQHRQRRKLVLATESRIYECKLNCAAMNIQRIVRGRFGRNVAYGAFLGQCAGRIAHVWRMRVLLWKRVKVLAKEYRAKMAAGMIQRMFRCFKARRTFRNRCMDCFHTFSVRTGFQHLNYLVENTVFGQHAFTMCFEFTKPRRTEDGFLDFMHQVREKYLETLANNPFDGDTSIGWEILQGLLRLFPSFFTDETEVSLFPVDEMNRESFKSISHLMFFDRAAKLYCESAMAWLNLSLTNRLILGDAKAAHQAAKQSCKYKSSGLRKKAVRANYKECVLLLLHHQCAARRIQSRWRRNKSGVANPHKLLQLRLMKNCPNRALWAHLKFAWSTHASMSDPHAAYETYAMVLKTFKLTPAMEVDVQCCQTLLYLASPPEFQQQHDLPGHFRRILISHGHQFAQSKRHRFCRILQNLVETSNPSPKALLNWCLLQFYGNNQDNSQAISALDRALRNQPLHTDIGFTQTLASLRTLLNL